MISAEFTRKIDLLPQESYSKAENLVEQLIDANNRKERAFRTFMKKWMQQKNPYRKMVTIY